MKINFCFDTLSQNQLMKSEMLEYYKEILNYVSKLVGDKESAKDIAQETFVRVMELDSNKQINCSFLYKTARNIVIDELRKNKKFSHVEFLEETFSIPKYEQPDEIVIEDNQYKNLMKIVNTLPSRSKEAFIFHAIDGYSRKEIAEIMGISQNAVEKHITRATKKLQEKLTNKVGQLER